MENIGKYLMIGVVIVAIVILVRLSEDKEVPLITKETTGNKAGGFNPASVYVEKDGDNMTGLLQMNSNPIQNLSYIDFNIDSPEPAYQDGRCFFTDTGDTTLNCVLDATNKVVNQVGEELYLDKTAKNVDTTIINNCEPVYISGAQGSHLTIKHTTSTNYRRAQATIGVATQQIPINGFGRVTLKGSVGDCDTSAFTDGAQLFLNSTGGFTTAYPPENETRVFVGIVAYSHKINGRISVGIQVMPKIEDLSYTNVSSINSSILVYNNQTGIWKNQNSITLNQYATYASDNASQRMCLSVTSDGNVSAIKC